MDDKEKKKKVQVEITTKTGEKKFLTVGKDVFHYAVIAGSFVAGVIVGLAIKK